MRRISLRGRRRPSAGGSRRWTRRASARAAGRSSSSPARPPGPNTGRRCWPPCPHDREMIVVDRPGFAGQRAGRPACPTSALQAAGARAAAGGRARPEDPAGRPDLRRGDRDGDGRKQPAAAGRRRAAVQLSRRGRPDRPLPGRTWGMRVLNLIPRDLRNAILEVSGQADAADAHAPGAAAAERAGARDPRRRRRLRADRDGRAAGQGDPPRAPDALHAGPGRRTTSSTTARSSL